ncbi:MAG: hypothetical protein ACM3YE_01190 [Bacteroidota bacterium]
MDNHPQLTEEEVDYIYGVIKYYAEKFGRPRPNPDKDIEKIVTNDPIAPISYRNLSDLDRIVLIEGAIKQDIKDNDFFGALFRLDKPYGLSAFENVFDYIPDQYKYETFRDVYMAGEYGFQDIPESIITKVFELAPRDFKDKLNGKIDKDGYLVVYRGEGSKSAPVVKAYSWTLSKKQAKWFALRFDNEGNVYKARIHIDKVIDYIEDREEEEILVRGEDVEILEKIKVN